MDEGYQERITFLLKSTQCTTGELAHAIGKGKATISRYLSKGNNRTYPTIEDLVKIAAFFDVQPHWLCFGIGDQATPAEALNQATKNDASLIKVYRRNDVPDLIESGTATSHVKVPVPCEYSDCFGVFYPISSTVTYKWDCIAIVNRKESWNNDDIVLARLPGNPIPDFFTLVKVGTTIHVWYGDDTSKNAIEHVDDDNIEIIGVVSWGTWKKRN
ncbi:helix-turn-helix domain-containing protein [Vibrio sp. ZSDZ34]|uniref:Helix-turn-helix domain-containing protein n=1 Tax=Vibrio gelatinilyticus TaxID=2893468 RepID=A0A9X1WAN4_9VIBR|nr:helix-turn-helix transcriptional regulator [Vibrio gelatinilyticus]MCJ2377088.1 helix-turn-helix domain-containing protein [Vibrio gelatinilyticus]